MKWFSAIVTALFVLTPSQAVLASDDDVSTEVQEVESTLIKSVAYDADTQVLTLVFVNNDETYEYANVPEEVYKDLMAAESKGSYFAKNIKGKYEFTKK